jgi:hypothetical protein
MKKINQKGFVLAETLVVAVFLMAIFTLIFTNFYPLIGEYEKRETYDDVDGKYSIYWIKRMIEDSSYKPTGNAATFFNNNGYIRFECKDVGVDPNAPDPEKQEMCKNLVQALEVKGCTSSGNHCEIYITKYQLGENTKSFKEATSKNEKMRYEINGSNKATYINDCKGTKTDSKTAELCGAEAEKKEFRSGFRDYVEYLPNYKVVSIDNAKYRVIACFQHRKDNNNYYSYSTIEVNR